MKKILKYSALTLALAASSSAFAVEPATSLQQAISNGNTTLSFRQRFEFVNQDSKKDALASTLKTRITYKTLQYEGLSSLLEFDNNSDTLAAHYNSKLNGKTQYAVIADPTYTDINQAYMNYAAPAETTLRIGRQRILLDNQRFIGGVGWRQNEQTFDAITLVNKSLADTTVILSNVTHVNTILNGITRGDHQVIHIHNSSLPFVGISAYAYLLKNISNTYGIRFNGSTKINNIKLLYTAEYANQKAKNSTESKANYYLAELGAAVGGVTTKVGYEVHTSDDGAYAFGTPVGTNHAFNGWADMFLATPVNGLKDTYLTIKTKLAGPKIIASFHKFNAERGNTDFGNELDLAVSKKFAKRYSALLGFADYKTKGFGSNTRKGWLQFTAKF